MRSMSFALVVIVALLAISSPVWADVTPGSWSVTDQEVISSGGTSAIAEADGSLVLNLQGVPGTPGRDGVNGRNGTDGRDGQNGRGLSSMRWYPDGNLFAFYDDGSSELVGTGLLGVRSMHLEYDGELFLVFSNGEKRPIVNLESMIEQIIERNDQEAANSRTALPGWFWPVLIPVLIWVSLLALAILLGVYFAQNANRRDENEGKRVGNMMKLIAGATMYGRTVRAKEQGRSGSEEFTILGGTGEISERVFTDDDWPYRRPPGEAKKPSKPSDEKPKPEPERPVAEPVSQQSTLTTILEAVKNVQTNQGEIDERLRRIERGANGGKKRPDKRKPKSEPKTKAGSEVEEGPAKPPIEKPKTPSETKAEPVVDATEPTKEPPPADKIGTEQTTEERTSSGRRTKPTRAELEEMDVRELQGFAASWEIDLEETNEKNDIINIILESWK